MRLFAIAVALFASIGLVAAEPLKPSHAYVQGVPES